MRKIKYLLKKLIFLSNRSRLSNLLGMVSSKAPNRHPTILKKKIGGIEIQSIETVLKVKIFKNDKDKGYHNYSNAWWYNLNCPYAFSYLDLDSLYPKQYFKHVGIGHPDSSS